MRVKNQFFFGLGLTRAGRGYPSIDSLKAISKLFKVSIDDLLCGEELITIAETEQKEKTQNMRELVFGVLDCMAVMLFILPAFGQESDGMIQAVSLFALMNALDYLRIFYIIIVACTVIFGVIEVILHKYQRIYWNQGKLFASLGFSVMGIMIFMISQQPYAGFFLLCMLVMKGILALKQR